MKVGQLIKKLQKYDPNLEIRDENTGYTIKKLSVGKADFAEKTDPKIVWFHLYWQE